MTPMIAPRVLTGLAAPILVLALLLVSWDLPALKDDNEKPIYMEADSAEFSEADSLDVYTGNVFVKQGSMELRGDQVTVHHDQEHNPTLIIVIGAPATYRQQVEGQEKRLDAVALRMEYERVKEEITLIDQAILFQGEDIFRSDRIIYNRAQAQAKAGVIAEGKRRVEVTLDPAHR